MLDSIKREQNKPVCSAERENFRTKCKKVFKDAHPLMLQLYRLLLERFPSKRIMIMGDSAGGGFSLALTQELKADSLDLPGRMILISPWVDVVGGDMQGLPLTELFTGTWETFYTDIVKTYDKMKAQV